MSERFIVEQEEAGARLDQYLQEKLEDVSRSQIRSWIDGGKVHLTVSGQEKAVKAGYKLRAQEIITVDDIEPKPLLNAAPQKMDLDIVYEDDDIAIVNKPQGLVVHPSAGHPDGTLVNGLMDHFQGKLSGINGVLRPGIVHRIDKDTSGLIVICKTDRAHQTLGDMLKDHDITRRYHAIVLGNIKDDEGTIDAPIGRATEDRKQMAIVRDGRRAVTHYRVLERLGPFTYVELTLETGRTHQIRVHMKHIHHPVLGDPVYGPKALNGQQAKMTASVKEELSHGQMLHAKVLGFVHPVTGEYMEWESPLPERFEQVLTALRNQTK